MPAMVDADVFQRPRSLTQPQTAMSNNNSESSKAGSSRPPVCFVPRSNEFNGPPKKRPNFLANVSSASSSSASDARIDKNIKELKKSLTLDFTSPESAKKTLQTPDVIRFLQLTSPELERFLKQGKRVQQQQQLARCLTSPAGDGYPRSQLPAYLSPGSAAASYRFGSVTLPLSPRAAEAPPTVPSLSTPGPMPPSSFPPARPVDRPKLLTMSPSEFYSYYLQPRETRFSPQMHNHRKPLHGKQQRCV